MSDRTGSSVSQVPVAEWGTRLADRIRAALDAGDFESARRLSLEGDGHARSLAREYALMSRGLGITVRLLLDLLGETVARRAPDLESTRNELATVLLRFRREMLELMSRAYGERLVREAISNSEALQVSAGGLEQELAGAARLMSEAEGLFSREQERLAAEAARAVEARDAEGARELLHRKEQGQYLPLHDRLVRFMAEAFAFVLKQFGSAELYRFHRATAEGQRQGFEKWERMTPAEFAHATAFLLKLHMGSVEVREDGEKFTIVQAPCGSGGRLRLAGAYSGAGALPFVAGPGPLTLGQERFPVYCSHCPIWNSVAPLEWFGRPHWVFDNPSRPDGSCTLHVYKRRDGAPASYYRRLA
jgi:hypothetical protein